MWSLFLFGIIGTTLIGKIRSRSQSEEGYYRSAAIFLTLLVAAFVTYDTVTLPSNLYDCLGVDDASAEKSTLRRAYKKAATDFHPDRAHLRGLDKESAEAEFIRVKGCWDTLNDEKRRQFYNTFGRQVEKDREMDEFTQSALSVILHHALKYFVYFVMMYVATIARERRSARGWCNAVIMGGVASELAMAHGGWDPMAGIPIVNTLPTYQQLSVISSLVVFVCQAATLYSQVVFKDYRLAKMELLGEIVAVQEEIHAYLASEPWKEGGTTVLLEGMDSGPLTSKRPPNWSKLGKIQQRKKALAAKEANDKSGGIPWGTIIFIATMAYSAWAK